MTNNQRTEYVSDAKMAASGIMAGLSTPCAKAVLEKLSTKRFSAGSEIIHHLNSGESVYFIIEGQVRVDMMAASGRQITYQMLDQGQMFGELSAIDGLPRSASVVAESDVLIAELSGVQFREVLEKQPEFAGLVMRRLANLARWLAAKLFEYHAYNVRGRVYLELLRIYEELSDKETLVKLSDKDMASRVGTTRENVTKIHGQLKKEGIISRNSEGIELLCPERLEDLLSDCEFG